MKCVKKGLFYNVIFQHFQTFKVIYWENRIRIETSTLPAICIFKRLNQSNFSNFWNMYFLCDAIISKLVKKGPKVVYHVSREKGKSKLLFDGTFRWGEFVSVINFSKYGNFTSLTQNWVKNCLNLYFMYQWR